jgi:hypothetical protein
MVGYAIDRERGFHGDGEMELRHGHVVLLCHFLNGMVISTHEDGCLTGISGQIGYGDYHVVTPAGRAVFVVWAILGVATLTILISCAYDQNLLSYYELQSDLHQS